MDQSHLQIIHLKWVLVDFDSILVQKTQKKKKKKKKKKNNNNDDDDDDNNNKNKRVSRLYDF